MRNKPCLGVLVLAVLVLLGAPARAQTPTPTEAGWTARDFKFHTGEVLPEMRLHYMTIGKPDGGLP